MRIRQNMKTAACLMPILAAATLTACRENGAPADQVALRVPEANEAPVPSESAHDATRRVINWAGRSWLVKSGKGRGPGPNTWSDDPQAVWVDDESCLHLTIAKRNNVWSCSEVSLEGPEGPGSPSLGWGDYEWTVDLPKQIPPKVVFSLFCYQDDTHEIEAIELSQWGDPNNDNCQYCLQPATEDSTRRFNVTSRSITVRFAWRPDQARFACWAGKDTDESAALIAAWSYSGPKLFRPGGERVHINYWLVSG